MLGRSESSKRFARKPLPDVTLRSVTKGNTTGPPGSPMLHADTTVTDDQYQTQSTALTLRILAPFSDSESETGS